MTRLFGTNGVRGVVNQGLTPELAMRLGKAIGTFMGGEIAIATDPRTSGDMIKSAVSAGMMSAGATVLDLGMLPTPALQFYVKSTDAVGGVMITASHNPPEFNGIKCVDGDGTELHRIKEEAIETIHFDASFGECTWDMVGSMQTVTGADRMYVDAIISGVDAEAIRASGMTVVLDCANGAGSVTSPALLDKIGVRTITLNGNPQGKFPGHPSEPTEDHLADLVKMVRELGADMGIAHDGDADRTIFVDDSGRYLYGDKSLAVMSRYMVRQNGGGLVVTPVSTSSCVEDAVKAIGGSIEYTRVGSPIVARCMIEKDAVFGGEENGGLIFPEHQYCRDGGMTAAKMLEVVAIEGPLSKLVDMVPEYHVDKRKIVCPDELKGPLMDAMAKRLGGRVDRTDGVKVFRDGGWTLIRPSGTEPIFRIFTEAQDVNSAREHGERFQSMAEDMLSQL